jgi:hypothetical protein
VESREAGGGRGAVGADPGIRRLGDLAPLARQTSSQVQQSWGTQRNFRMAEARLSSPLVFYGLAGDDPVNPSLGAAVGCVLDRLYNR